MFSSTQLYKIKMRIMYAIVYNNLLFLDIFYMFDGLNSQFLASRPLKNALCHLLFTGQLSNSALIR
jgi:hypothetical protein